MHPMLLASPSTQTRLADTLTWLTAAVDTFAILASASDLPFVKHISIVARSLLASIETVRHNKNQCIQLLEQIHTVLYGIIELHIKSDTGGRLSPAMLEQMGNFTETLNKIHTFLDAQQEKNKFKQLLRQSEMSALLKDCTAELNQAVEILRVGSARLLTDAMEMNEYAEQTHLEVLSMLESADDGRSIAGSSINNTIFSGDYDSSNSLSLLPSEPKIFLGRESEVSDILYTLNRETPRIAILGPGGIGKTSLARTILHHPEVHTRYADRRFFVICDSASTKLEVAALIAAHLGLKPSKDPTDAIIRHFSDGAPCLLVLDNLDTAWEPQHLRRDVEDFLALLSAVEHLALIITMRGAERPGKVRWTRPFLPPLKPLEHAAAREIFFEIADDVYDDAEVDKILALTGNMPLAVDLISHLVSAEGCSNILSRWEMEKTSLVSEGHDRRSNLELSIAVSLSSPRITAVPHALDLLSLLSMLPDGLSDVELLQSKLQMDDVLRCKLALLRTSLAYNDDVGRLRCLVPIREYTRNTYPPSPAFVHSLLAHFAGLLQLYLRFHGTPENTAIVGRIRSNFVNIENLLLHGLQVGAPDLAATIQCAIAFARFGRVTGRVRSQLLDIMDRIPGLLPRPPDRKLEIHFIMEAFNSATQHPSQDPEALIQQAEEHFRHLDDPSLQCSFYMIIGGFYMRRKSELQKALKYLTAARALSDSTGSAKRQSQLLCDLSTAYFFLGDYSSAQVQAHDAQRLAQLAGNLYHEARALATEVNSWAVLGNYNRALSLSRRTTYLLRLCGLTESALGKSVLNVQAEIHKAKSEYVEARALHTQIWQQGSDPLARYREALALLNIAMVETLLGTHNDGKLDKARSISTRMRYVPLIEWCDVVRADIGMQEGDEGPAYEQYQRSARSAWGKDDQKVTYCLERLGDYQRWTTLDCPSSWTTVFLVHALKTRQKLEIHKGLQFLGDWFLDTGDARTATNLFLLALEGFTAMDIHQSRAECMLRLGDRARKQEDVANALAHWKEARPLFERASQTKQIIALDERIAAATERTLAFSKAPRVLGT